MKSIGVIGAGTWGLALARALASNGNDVTVWSAIPSEIDELVTTHKNHRLPEMIIPDSIAFTKSLEVACQNKDIILFAVPSLYVRETAEKVRSLIPDYQFIVDVAKGIEKPLITCYLKLSQLRLKEMANTITLRLLLYRDQHMLKKWRWICQPPLFQLVRMKKLPNLFKMSL